MCPASEHLLSKNEGKLITNIEQKYFLSKNASDKTAISLSWCYKNVTNYQYPCSSCVAHTKPITLTLTLTIIGFQTLIGVRNPNPKQDFSCTQGLRALSAGKVLFRVRVAP